MGKAMAEFDDATLPQPYRAAMWNHMQRVAYMMINQGPRSYE